VGRGFAATGAVATALLLSGGAADAAPKDPQEREPPKCVAGADLKFFKASPRSAELRDKIKFSWDISVPRGCSSGSLDLYVVYRCGARRRVSGLKGSLTLPALGSTTYSLIARKAGAERSLGRESVVVKIPNPVTIDGNGMAPTLIHALGTKDQTIRVRNNVDMSLTGCEGIPVNSGVKLVGGRSATNPGPRIKTSAYPVPLLNIRGDNVLIRGMRIEGARMDVFRGKLHEVYLQGIPGLGLGEIKASYGILVNGNTGVEIDNNEIYGWMGAGVEIRDNDEGRIPPELPHKVRVHNNYIHHNRQGGGNGYGVAVRYGAFALIDRNVFDYNRHAVSGQGTTEKGGESGYALFDNVVLGNGGEHVYIPGSGWDYTHQIDMHGSESCFGGHLNCGQGGHHMDIQHNAFFYTRNPAIKLRGTPKDPRGMLVANNSFTLPEFQLGSLSEAAAQTESGLREQNNEYLAFPTIMRCDYDGRGQPDFFMATGRNWWYSIRGAPHWFFMIRSTERPATCPRLVRDHRIPGP
jgi:hypothetical protein